MEEGPFYVIALAEVLPECAGEVHQIMRRLAELSRQEPGCLRYDVFFDLSDARRINTVEAWRDKAAFEAHLERSHVTEAIRGMDGKLSRPPDIRAIAPLESIVPV